jgi:hypothetical protein
VSLSVGAPLGNLGRGIVYRELREIAGEGPQKWSISFYGSSVGGTRKGGSFARDTEGYEKGL